ncbi:hypothetical protein LZ30DRAFT_740979 [Colletotrichum cereale]|nr:hypothetical protein LZ30DRAFT_740979 [Colletotrichum cereale]
MHCLILECAEWLHKGYEQYLGTSAPIPRTVAPKEPLASATPKFSRTFHWHCQIVPNNWR